MEEDSEAGLLSGSAEVPDEDGAAPTKRSALSPCLPPAPHCCCIAGCQAAHEEGFALAQSSPGLLLTARSGHSIALHGCLHTFAQQPLQQQQQACVPHPMVSIVSSASPLVI